jgi:FKBP-type peptidyl-prolyl cis-trans isomerase SlyD
MRKQLSEELPMSGDCVAKDKLISLTYRIVDAAGNLLEQVDVPVRYIHGGKSDLIEKIQTALEGHCVGEQVQVTVEPEDAFGEHDPLLTYTDELENVPQEFRRVGAEVEMQNEQGDTKTFVVSRIKDGKLTVDGNHPLAGKVLTFHVKIEGVRDATKDELHYGVQRMPPTLH